MSLDVYLVSDTASPCEHCGGTGINHDNVFSANITHNLNKMADAAGIYKHLWRPDEIGITTAAQLIEPLREGLARMKAAPDKYKKHDSPNGWGLYEHFVPWIETYLDACIANPGAKVEVSR